MIGQVEGNIVTRCSRTDDNDLLPDVLFPGCILEGVHSLTPEFFLRPMMSHRCTTKCE